MKIWTCAVIAGLVLAQSVGSHAATMTTNGYTIGSGLLGSTIVDGATHAGLATFDVRANDTGNGAGPYVWVSSWDNLWNAGDSVSLTGIAVPVRSPNTGTANNTADGDWTFTFYELSGGADQNLWNGTANGEVELATRVLEFRDAGTGGAIIPYATFDTPIEFTAGSTGIAIHMDSTSSIRTRSDSAPDGVDGIQFNRSTGANNNRGHQWTLAGTVTQVPEPQTLGLALLGALAFSVVALRKRLG